MSQSTYRPKGRRGVGRLPKYPVEEAYQLYQEHNNYSQVARILSEKYGKVTPGAIRQQIVTYYPDTEVQQRDYQNPMSGNDRSRRYYHRKKKG